MVDVLSCSVFVSPGLDSEAGFAVSFAFTFAIVSPFSTLSTSAFVALDVAAAPPLPPPPAAAAAVFAPDATPDLNLNLVFPPPDPAVVLLSAYRALLSALSDYISVF